MTPAKSRAPGTAIRSYLDRHNISQQDFADKLGVSQSIVSQWVRGTTPVSPKMARLIEREYGIPRLALIYPDEHAA